MARAKSSKRKIIFIILIFILILGLLIFGPVIYKIAENKVLQSRISSFYSPDTDLTGKKPGEVLKIEAMQSPVLGGKGYRILYVSELSDGSPVPVSGMIFVSSKNTDKRNIVAWAHGTVGLGKTCAPSRGLVPTANLEPWLSMMMDRGWIVVATDYSGLGVSGQNQYLVGISEGRDVLNSIRAVKSLSEFNPGEKALVFGHSQGGNSALFSANIAGSYAKDIDLVGVVAAAPAAELNSLLQLQFDKQLVWAIAPEIFVSWVNQFNLPTDIVNSSFDTQEENKKIADLCIQDKVAQAIIGNEAKKDYFKTNPNSNARWFEVMQKQTPEPVLGMPTLILQGLADNIVLPATTSLFVKKSCAEGSSLTSLWYKDVGHLELPNVTSDDSVDWIANRFEGEKAVSNCNLPLPVAPAEVIPAPSN